MEPLLTVKDLMERYQCSRNTAIKRMREMRHMEKPLMVTQSAVEMWERCRTYEPGGTAARQETRSTFTHLPYRKTFKGGKKNDV